MKQKVEELVAYYKREFQFGRYEGIVQTVQEIMNATGQTVKEVVTLLSLSEENTALCCYVLESAQDRTVEKAVEAYTRMWEKKE